MKGLLAPPLIYVCLHSSVTANLAVWGLALASLCRLRPLPWPPVEKGEGRGRVDRAPVSMDKRISS